MSSSVSSVFENDHKTVSFGQKLAGSEAFKALFKEGMSLVEASAAYLDGAGRAESKALPRGAALAYASESMRLTTRLMQLASWLLLQRATEKKKVKLSRQDYASDPQTFAALPSTLQDLCRQSVRLQERIIHLDSLLYQTEVREIQMSRPPGIESQLNMLHEAFSAPRA